MAPRFDITRVRLRNYKSIESCDVELGPLTLLVGPNGSGKSNFLDALQFVADALNTNLENALRERGGFRSVSRFGESEVEIEITLGSGVQTRGYRVVLAPVDGVSYRVVSEAWKYSDSSEWSVDVFDGPEHIGLPRGRIGERHLPVLKVLSGFRSFSPIPEQMRDISRPDLGDRLLRDGSNAPNVIARLESHDPPAKQLVEEYLRLVVDGLTGVESRQISSWRALFFKQEIEGVSQPREFDALSMSDGTLHALGVLIALFEGAETVGIEEPESGLHPAAAAVLMDALRDSAHRRQVIVTTHSPDLLDVPGLQPSEVLAVRSVRGKTVIGRLNDAGTYALKESLYSPGALLRTNYLQPETDE
ncbi:AAA family ATPase [Kutzneria kofuensis]|uniref:Putative ATPase n=1 Tax=Kutzneria kofuensis TaxID=103725 RepID=A0A7W9KJE3_9PSEU|nr:AAA family ATPase [Kutzneria kofuensis]MBB5893545.1 putative ATPase [Kutzneria kofuensis]